MGSVQHDALNAALQAAVAQHGLLRQQQMNQPANHASWSSQWQPLMPSLATAHSPSPRLNVFSAMPRVEPATTRQQPRARAAQQPSPQQSPQQQPSTPSARTSTASSGAQTDPEPQGRPGVTTRAMGTQTKGTDGHCAVSQSGKCLRRAWRGRPGYLDDFEHGLRPGSFLRGLYWPTTLGGKPPTHTFFQFA